MDKNTVEKMKPGASLDLLVRIRVMGWSEIPNNEFIGTKFEPSTVIGDAWKVAEKLRDLNWNVTVGICGYLPEYHSCELETASRGFQILAASVPEAIAKAALLTTI